MKKSIKPLVLAIAAANAGAALPSLVFAEDAVSPLEEIIVTATRRETNLLETPIAITAVSGADLAKLNITDIRSLNQVVPGLQVRDNGVDGQGSVDINLRGVGNSNFIETGESNVAFNIDGVYTARPQAVLQMFNDVQQVEVSRGPQGTLSSRNATAGSINVITNKPTFDEVSGSLEVEAGTFNNRAVRGVLNLPVTDTFALRMNYAAQERDSVYDFIDDNSDPTGVNSDKIAAPSGPLPATWADSTPYFQSIYGDSTDDGPGSAGSKDSEAYRISALWQPTENLSWLTAYEVFQDNALGSPMTVDCKRADCEQHFTPEQIAELDPYTSVQSFRGEKDQKITNIRTSLEYNIPELFTIKYTYGRSEMDHTMVQDLDGGVAVELAFIDEPWLNDSDVHDLQFSSNGDGPLHWTAGYFNFKEVSERQFAVSFFPWGFQVFDNPNYTVKTEAAYADFTYEINDKLEVFAGVRYSKDKKSNSGATKYDFSAQGYACPGALGATHPDGLVFLNAGVDFILDTPECVFSSTEAEPISDTFTDFRLGASYQLTDDVNVYASVSTGHKAALQNQQIDNIRVGGQLSIPVATEELISWELGSKGTLFDGTVQFSAALFFMDYEDKQEAMFLNFGDTGCDANGNGINDQTPEEGPGCAAGEDFSFDDITDLNDDEFPDQIEYSVTNADMEVYGFELEAAGQITENGYLSGFFTWTEAEYTDFDYSHTLGCPSDTLNWCGLHDVSGNQPRSTPKFTFNLSYSHTFTFSNGGTLVPTVNAYYRSKYYLTPENVTGIDPSLIPAGSYNLPDGTTTTGVTNESELYSDEQEGSIKLNLALTYTSPSQAYSVELYGTNVLDEEVKTHMRIDTASTPMYVYEEPALYGARIRYNF